MHQDTTATIFSSAKVKGCVQVCVFHVLPAPL